MEHSKIKKFIAKLTNTNNIRADFKEAIKSNDDKKFVKLASKAKESQNNGKVSWYINIHSKKTFVSFS